MNPWPEVLKDVFFDLDNTLWDYRKNAEYTLRQIFPKYQKQLSRDISFERFYPVYEQSNDALWNRINRGEITKDYLRNHRFPDAFRALGCENDALGIELEHEFLDSIADSHLLVEGAEELLKDLKSKGYELHILSNGFEEVTHHKVAKSALNGYFTSITSADELGIRKPEAKIYQHALMKAKARPSTSVMIGDDWLADIVGAENFGMAAVYFKNSEENIPEYPRVALTLAEVLTWCK